MVELVALADLLIELGAEAWQLQLTVPMGRAPGVVTRGGEDLVAARP